MVILTWPNQFSFKLIFVHLTDWNGYLIYNRLIGSIDQLRILGTRVVRPKLAKSTRLDLNFASNIRLAQKCHSVRRFWFHMCTYHRGSVCPFYCIIWFDNNLCCKPITVKSQTVQYQLWTQWVMSNIPARGITLGAGFFSE